MNSSTAHRAPRSKAWGTIGAGEETRPMTDLPATPFEECPFCNGTSRKCELAWPQSAEQIAERWGVGKRWLKTFARAHGLGREAGKRLLFDREAYENLFRSLSCPSASIKEPAPGYGTSAGPSAVAVSMRLRARKAALSRKPSGRSGKRMADGLRKFILALDAEIGAMRAIIEQSILGGRAARGSAVDRRRKALFVSALL